MRNWKTKSDSLLHRIEFGFGFTWHFFPNEMTWREWFFSPQGGVTWPGKCLSDDKMSVRELDHRKGNLKMVDNKFYARYFWLHGALRIIGLDVGISIFYKMRNEIENGNSTKGIQS